MAARTGTKSGESRSKSSNGTTGGRGEARGTRMVRTSIDIKEQVRSDMVNLLNQQLADTFDLMSISKQAHWNVKGPEFFQLHELFDLLAEGLLPHVDAIAERVTALGGVAMGTARMAAANSRIPEFTGEPFDGIAHVRALTERFAQLAQSTRAGIDTADAAGDTGTADLLTEIVRDLDKWLWFLEAHVQE